MANTIKHKRGSGSDPAASDLVLGELAIRTDTGTVFTKKSDGTVVQITGGGGNAADADTVDNLHASSFLRSDANDTASGVITHTNRLIIDHNTGTMLEIKPTGGSPWALGINRDDLTDSRVFTHNPSSQGVGWVFEHNPYWYNSGSYSKFLTTADEGSGGGIDADTVDGIQAASFLRSDAADVKSAGDLRWNDGVYAKFGTNEDLEIAHTSGNSHIRTVSGSAGDLYIQSQGTGHDLYLRATDDVFIQPQGGENGIKVIGDGGVELYHNNSKKFETTSVGNTSTGPLTINGTGQYVGNWGYNTLVLTDTSGYPGITWQHGTNNWLQRMESTTDMQWAFRSGGNYTERMQLTTGGVLTVNSNTVWHAGNDGSGSGLDADTVDGCLL